MKNHLAVHPAEATTLSVPPLVTKTSIGNACRVSKQPTAPDKGEILDDILEGADDVTEETWHD